MSGSNALRGLRAAVVGGSIGGCSAAIALHRAGCRDITVHERTTGALADRGVGVAMHAGRYAELEAAGYLDAAMSWGRLVERHWYVRDGSVPLGRVLGTNAFPFRTYNWGLLWSGLYHRLPAEVGFRTGNPVVSVEESAAGAEVHTADGGERYDLVVGADGYRSVVRAAVCPRLQPRDAGYLAWRGAYPESRLPDAGLWPRNSAAYVVFGGGHVVLYRIPGADGVDRVNWVLYTTPPIGLGTHDDHPASVSPGTLAEPFRAHLHELVQDRLPPFWATLITRTRPEELFVQPMYDFAATPGASGVVALLGDAASVARPHTGAGAVKALQDATLLESALRTADGGPVEALKAYDLARGAAGSSMVALGRQLGRALVEATPDWAALDPAGLEAWWRQADAAGLFGGRRLGK
ncbi:FAD-dependent monooxygenase [Streptomyces albipurpureus]|uniref:FAD-dependent monooxygenase n=1 Tax=Streptomyces albipurpureus TaxID=2897419 RepID=A0ABT0UW24_9ACTN|nr:FAD-dependent monooxygenase [Streptomyces sp. CWNU-1]MCM2392787.1 FAD-dependent monooxygenase [Streptomyces sp. CWNU-1]